MNNNIKRGQIYLLDLKQAQGSVQAGVRPVIVIQNDVGNTYSQTTVVCSITSKHKKSLPTHVRISGGGLRDKSIVLCEQIFTIDTNNLTNLIGTITDQVTLNKINKRIALSLGLTSINHDKT